MKKKHAAFLFLLFCWTALAANAQTPCQTPNCLPGTPPFVGVTIPSKPARNPNLPDLGLFFVHNEGLANELNKKNLPD
jgi:hypothetical protein